MQLLLTLCAWPCGGAFPRVSVLWGPGAPDVRPPPGLGLARVPCATSWVDGHNRRLPSPFSVSASTFLQVELELIC